MLLCEKNKNYFMQANVTEPIKININALKLSQFKPWGEFEINLFNQ